MISHELVLLGLLYERPRHGYEIKKRIREILTLFAGLEATSVYYPLTVLENSGCVVKQAQRQGSRPQRIVYSLTDKGKARFLRLLEKSFFDFTRPRFSLDMSLYFLHYLPAPDARRRLRARMRILDKIAAQLRTMAAAVSEPAQRPLGRILQHNQEMVETEAKFLQSLVASLA